MTTRCVLCQAECAAGGPDLDCASAYTSRGTMMARLRRPNAVTITRNMRILLDDTRAWRAGFISLAGVSRRGIPDTVAAALARAEPSGLQFLSAQRHFRLPSARLPPPAPARLYQATPAPQETDPGRALWRPN